ncbi:hypothetical protein MMC29_000383 [Sticta canariensis]|nr:hypothetical protein [Sticta canariensis]
MIIKAERRHLESSSRFCAAVLLKQVALQPTVAPGVLRQLQQSAGLDADQAEALVAALSKELSLIQGPPGTGKTYIGIKIVQAILANTRPSVEGQQPVPRLPHQRPAAVAQQPVARGPDIGPILVICFTNHALDQFLEGLLKAGVTEGLVRIGGRGHSELLQAIHMHVLHSAITELAKGIEAIKVQLCSTSLIPFRILQPVIEAMDPEVHDVLTWHDDFEGQWQTQGKRDSLRDWLQPRKHAAKFQKIQKILKRPEDLTAAVDSGGSNVAQHSNAFDILAGTGSDDFEQAGQHAAAARSSSAADSHVASAAAESSTAAGAAESSTAAGAAENSTAADAAPDADADMSAGLSLALRTMCKIRDWLVQQSSESSLWQHTRWPGSKSIWTMPLQERWQLYNTWAARHHQILTDELMTLLQSHALHVAQLKQAQADELAPKVQTTSALAHMPAGRLLSMCQNRVLLPQNVYEENNRDILRAARVVGVTTTGAAMHQGLLAGMGSRVAVVEEAGEVLESHILASLSPSCEQLVLIGDHNQLRPKTQVCSSDLVCAGSGSSKLCTSRQSHHHACMLLALPLACPAERYMLYFHLPCAAATVRIRPVMLHCVALTCLTMPADSLPVRYAHGMLALPDVLPTICHAMLALRLYTQSKRHGFRGGNLPVHTMLVQRRMRPSISELIRMTIYPSLIDGSCVKTYPPAAGDMAAFTQHCISIIHNVFFLDHQHMEEQEARTQSHVNKWEAKMTAAIALHMSLKAAAGVLAADNGLEIEHVLSSCLCLSMRFLALKDSRVWQHGILLAEILTAEAAEKRQHACRQGCYGPEDIAVITPYLGQLLLLRQELQRHTVVQLEEADASRLADLAENAVAAEGSAPARPGLLMDPGSAEFGSQSTPVSNPMAAEAAARVKRSSLQSCLRLATVDNFQGEEAKIIIISLVRSNKDGRAGFLNTSNRINVLLSRAMHGMVLVGNEQTFAAAKKTPMWRLVLDKLKARGEVGSALPLRCQQHPDYDIEVREPHDFAVFAGDGGCHRQCEFRLPCGHTCRRSLSVFGWVQMPCRRQAPQNLSMSRAMPQAAPTLPACLQGPLRGDALPPMLRAGHQAAALWAHPDNALQRDSGRKAGHVLSQRWARLPTQLQPWQSCQGSMCSAGRAAALCLSADIPASSHATAAQSHAQIAAKNAGSSACMANAASPAVRQAVQPFCLLCVITVPSGRLRLRTPDQVVDMIMFTAYQELDLASSPVLVLGCGHIFTVETLDGHMGLHDVFKIDQHDLHGDHNLFLDICAHAGQCIGLKPLQEHTELSKGCPTCSAPISGIQRYGRIIKKAMNDLMDRKFAQQNRMALLRVQAAIEPLAADPDGAAKQNQLGMDVLGAIHADLFSFMQQCQSTPSLKVYQAACSYWARNVGQASIQTCIVPPNVLPPARLPDVSVLVDAQRNMATIFCLLMAGCAADINRNISTGELAQLLADVRKWLAHATSAFACMLRVVADLATLADPSASFLSYFADWHVLPVPARTQPAQDPGGQAHRQRQLRLRREEAIRNLGFRMPTATNQIAVDAGHTGLMLLNGCQWAVEQLHAAQGHAESRSMWIKLASILAERVHVHLLLNSQQIEQFCLAALPGSICQDAQEGLSLQSYSLILSENGIAEQQVQDLQMQHLQAAKAFTQTLSALLAGPLRLGEGLIIWYLQCICRTLAQLGSMQAFCMLLGSSCRQKCSTAATEAWCAILDPVLLLSLLAGKRGRRASGKCSSAAFAYAGGKVRAGSEAERLRGLVTQLSTEHSTLLQACQRHITLEEKRMVFNAIGYTGTGFTGQVMALGMPDNGMLQVSVELPPSRPPALSVDIASAVIIMTAGTQWRPGLRHDLFFVNHEHHEGHTDSSRSQTNAWQAKMVSAIALQLVSQACYSPEDIAVLTPYLGQYMLLQRELSAHTVLQLEEADVKAAADATSHAQAGPSKATWRAGKDLPAASAAAEAAVTVSEGQLRSRIRLATADSFQAHILHFDILGSKGKWRCFAGVEAKVVIIALTRSSAEGKVGFLSTPNRINVLLSRAMHGMVLVGNADTFTAAKGTDMWEHIISQLSDKGVVGNALPLQCQLHPEDRILVKEPGDFELIAGDGGWHIGHAISPCHADTNAIEGLCMGLEPLPSRAHSEPARVCPSCRTQVTGIQRCERIIQKSIIDLKDDKFVMQKRIALARLQDQTAMLAQSSEQSGAQGMQCMEQMDKINAQLCSLMQTCEQARSSKAGHPLSWHQGCSRGHITCESPCKVLAATQSLADISVVVNAERARASVLAILMELCSSRTAQGHVCWYVGYPAVKLSPIGLPASHRSQTIVN